MCGPSKEIVKPNRGLVPCSKVKIQELRCTPHGIIIILIDYHKNKCCYLTHAKRGLGCTD